MKRARLVVVISGRGRNLQGLIASMRRGHLPVELTTVISNRSDAAGLAFAREANVPTVIVPHKQFEDRDAFDAVLAHFLRAQKPDVIALAGFMRVLGEPIVREFEGRMLNIHPSLLPKYTGLHTHERVRLAGDAEHGATVHFVTPQLDGGPRVVQGRFSVNAEDSPQTLAQRVMDEIELKIYPQAVAWLARGDLGYENGTAVFRGKPLLEPLTLQDLEPEFR